MLKTYTVKILLLLFAIIFLISSFYLTGHYLIIKNIILLILYPIIFIKRERIAYLFLRIVQQLNIKKIIILGFSLRILWAVFASYPQESDFAEFHKMAIDILHGSYIFNPLKSTGTSIVTAFIYKIFGINQLFALMPIVIISSIQIWLVYELTKMVFNKNAALLAAIFIALFPDSLFYVNLISSDVYFSFFVILSLFFFLKKYKLPYLNLILSGISIGVAQYFRETSVLVLFSLIALILFLNSKSNTKGKIKKGIILIFSFIAITLPIMRYNYINFNSISISTSQMGGWSLYIGTNIIHKGHINYDDLWLLQKMTNAKTLKDIQYYNNLGKKMAFERIMKNPYKFLINGIIFKPYYLWSFSTLEVYSWHGISSIKIQLIAQKLSTLIHRIFLFMISVLLIQNIFKMKLENKILIFFLFFAFATTFANMFLEVRARYHHMFIPLFAVIFSEWIYYYNSKRAIHAESGQNLLIMSSKNIKKLDNK